MSAMKKPNLKGLSRKELVQFVTGMGEKPFRASQIWSWIYQKGANDFDVMSSISVALRTRLSQSAAIGTIRLADKQVSSTSKTIKFLWELEDGRRIESVYIPEGKRRTVCISSQVGCALKCGFCATGQMGFQRDLMPYEIIDQVLGVRRETGEQPTNIVVMGMGEPFLNYDNVIKALTIINDPEGIAIGHRKITISTSGIIPQIQRYTREGQPFKLAISLNATTDSLRSKLMPINKKYPLTDLIQSAREYAGGKRNRVTFEYVLLKGVNDTDEDARRLLKLLGQIPCKVNLIAYNPTSNKYQAPDEKRIETFADLIRPLCAPVTLRLSKGNDIHAACGQLIIEKRIHAD
jgi:23S rRNA (adenine2503-C2)-methyltransferase